MDVHKKTTALVVYSASVGAVLDEQELLHELPKITKYLQKSMVINTAVARELVSLLWVAWRLENPLATTSVDD